MNVISSPRIISKFGRSIELNPLGKTKVCTFDCIYCSLGPSTVRMSKIKTEVKFPSVEEILLPLRQMIMAEAGAERTIDTLVVSGNGEPTLYPHLGALIREINAIRSTLMPKMRTVILTNGDRLDDRDVTEALNQFDERIVKLDVGTNKFLKSINRPLSRSTLERIIMGARSLRDLSIQTAVISGESGTLDKQNLDEWLEVVAMLNPKAVYLHAVRKPMVDTGLLPSSEEDVNKLAHWIERKLKFRAQVEFDFAA